MAISVVMPALEMAQENGTLIAWRKKEGQAVSKGEPLLEVETDKAVVEIEAPAGGILAGIKAQPGDIIPVGQTIAWIVAQGEPIPRETPVPESAARPAGAPAGAASPAATTAPKLSNEKSARISPKARRLAAEKGVDIGGLRGSGRDGTVTSEDVLAAAAKSAASPAESETLSSVARLMAERTTQSWTSVPHFFVVREVDAGALLQAREERRLVIESSRGVSLTITDLLVALVARALLKHPRLNSSFSAGAVRLHAGVNISVAMAVKDGVVGAVIHDAHQAELGEIAARRQELAERARANRLRPDDIAGGTFTISNLGMYQVDAFSAIIAAPQAAILAVGAISDRVVPVDGRPGIRPGMTLTLSCDHRVVDGARAAEFMRDLADAIGAPRKILG
jgi:pyruvate dehydrogenase E2 component (dihydrolipoamide acetyltransferase)